MGPWAILEHDPEKLRTITPKLNVFQPARGDVTHRPT
jgi:hypothetical protein